MYHHLVLNHFGVQVKYPTLETLDKSLSGGYMIEIRGKYNTAKVFTDNVESQAMEQIRELCDQEYVKDSIIRIMPDCHAGAGCTIGTTMTITDKIVPNLVGVDIGCGMETIKLKQKEIDFAKLDRVIYDYIPAGFEIRKRPHKYVENIRSLMIWPVKNMSI
jgi:tRNA-splicing ligase RtcB